MQHAAVARRILVLLGAALIVGLVRWLLRRRTGGHGSELTASIWFHAGHPAPLRTLNNAVVSVVIVGMGAAFGR